MKPILIIGGGMSGITAAVELAEVGKDVILIEREAYLGGNVIRMNNYFPKLCPPSCGLEINFRRIRQNPRIQYYTSTQVKDITGSKSNFKVRINIAPEWVKNNCTACGKCQEVCPVEIPNDFNYGLDTTKAIHLPNEMAFPYKYHMDTRFCKKESCNECVKVCEYNAIDFSIKEKEMDLEVDSIIVASGWHPYDASKIKGYHYSDLEDVVTNMELERILAHRGPTEGKLIKPSNKEEAKDFVFVQCAGSRDENYLPYCSAVCCSASLKHALNIQERIPDSRIKIFYIDLRVTGRNEDFLNKAVENPNIELIKGKVANIEKQVSENKLIVEAEDILEGKKKKFQTDMVILATGIVPNDAGINLPSDDFGFYDFPENTKVQIAACSKKPMDVSASVKDATAASLRAIQS